MKKFLFALFLGLLSAPAIAQDWHQVGMNFTSVDKKKIAVNDNGFVAMFLSNSAGGTGHFWLYDPNSMMWSEVNGPYNGLTVIDINLETDGNEFIIYYTTSSQDQNVWSITETGTLTDMSSGLANSIFSMGYTDLFLNKNTGDMYLVGTNGDVTDVNVMGWTGSNWDTLQMDFMAAAGVSTSGINWISGYANAQDVYIGVSIFNGSDGIGLFSSQIGTWNWQYANGVNGISYTPQATHVEIDGDGTGYPIIVSNNTSSSDSVMYYEYDGGGMNVNSGINIGGPTVTNIEVGFVNGKKRVMVTHDGASDNTHVYSWNGSSFDDAHPSMLGRGMMNDFKSSFAMHSSNGKEYIIIEESLDDIKVLALNTTPVVDNIVINDLCLNGYGYAFEPIDIKDDDGDSTGIAVRSLDQSIIGDNDISNDFFSRNGQITSYGTYVGWTNLDGTVNLEVVVNDGIIRDTSVHQVIVHPSPVIDYSALYDVPLCNTNGPVDMNPHIVPQGGNWSGFAIDANGMMDPILAQQDPTIYYDYYDQNGCGASDEISLNAFIGPVITAEPATPASCGNTDGQAEISIAAGSTNDYMVQWSTGDTNTLMIGSLAAGQYVINVIDTNGCTNFLNYSVPSSDINVVVNPTAPLCEGSATGSIDITVSGNGPFSYYWITGDTTEDLTNVVGGVYTVMITDNNGCEATEVVDLTSLSTNMALDAYANDGQCMVNDGGVSVFTVFGGTAPYTFLWSNGQTTQDLTNVAPGVYSVIVTDNNNCTYNDTFTVSSVDGPYIDLEGIMHVDCNQSNGSIDVTVMAGQNPPVTFAWSNGANTEDISNLNPGTYTLVATDAAGCEGQATFAVNSVKPQVQPICLVTVDSLTTTNLLVWERVDPTGISHYNIYRETGAVNNYPLVGTVSAADESIWNDVSASPLVTSWRYKMSQVDDCGVESNLSLHHKTMHVTISKGLGTTYNIFWDDYEGISYSTVNLYRYDDANGLTVLATLPSSNSSYTDDPGNDTLNLDYFVGFDLASPCTSSRAQDYNGTRSNRSAGIFDPGDGIGLSIIENSDLSDDINIYPNPNSGNFTITFGNTVLGNKSIRVLDARGRIVSYKNTTLMEYDMKLNHLEDGVYFVEIINNTRRGVKRIIIQ